MYVSVMTYLLVLGDDVREELGADFGIVAPLLEVDSVHLARLNGLGNVGRVNLSEDALWLFGLCARYTYLQDAVLSALFLLEDVQSLGRVAGSNDPVRDLAGDDTRGSKVARCRKCNEVTERRHTVSTCNAVSSVHMPQGQDVPRARA